ncbi:MAG TPA: SRPBCC domain-containing protein [Parafilimonas sp.]|nr:SRPBCC domain-containing protein [Parafilimonas sp.]
MKNENYSISFNTNASAKAAFKNINNVAGWWTKNIEGNTENVNDVFTVRFGETFVTFEITEIIPERKIVWKVTGCNLHWLNNKKEWNNTKVHWLIAKKNNSTKITMMHEGLIPQIECYTNCEKGWNFYVGESLRKLINEGQGLPDTAIAARV